MKPIRFGVAVFLAPSVLGSSPSREARKEGDSNNEAGKTVSQNKFPNLLISCMVDVMDGLLGEGGRKALLFHFDWTVVVDQAEKFHRNLFAILKDGSIVLEREIAKELFRRLHLQYTETGSFEFGQFVTSARQAMQSGVSP